MIKIKELRQAKNMSLRDLAAELNISYSSLSKYEREDQQPSIETLISIANYFNVSVDYLIGITNSKYPENRNISDELCLSDEAINILKNLSSTIAYENKISLSDILNAMITNPKFSKLLKSILIHISRNSNDWNKFCEFLNQQVPGETSLSEAERFSQATIADEFNSLLTELLNSKIHATGSDTK